MADQHEGEWLAMEPAANTDTHFDSCSLFPIFMIFPFSDFPAFLFSDFQMSHFPIF